MAVISGIMEHFPYMGLFSLLVLGGIGLPFPEGATLILCGFLISVRVIELLPALAIAFSGMLTGDLLSYFFGRKYGRMIVSHRRFRGIMKPESLAVFEGRFKRWGPLLILIGGRLISGVFLVAGVMGMPVAELIIIDAVSSALAIAVWVGTGYVGGRSLRIIQEDITRIEHLAVLLIVALIVILLFVRYFRSVKRE